MRWISLILLLPVMTPRPLWAMRLISLLPSNTEIVESLGAGNDIIGITTYDTQMPGRSAVGDLINPNIEKMVSLKPDLILAGQWESSRIVSRLRTLGYTVVEIPNPRSITQVYDGIRAIARAIGREKEARVVIQEMQARLDAVRRRAQLHAPVRLYIDIDRGGWTPGGPDFITDAVRIAGGENIFSDIAKEAAPVSIEAVLARNPEVVLCLNGSRADLESEASLPALPAIRKNHVIDDLPPNSLNRPSPHLVDGIERLATELSVFSEARR